MNSIVISLVLYLVTVVVCQQYNGELDHVNVQEVFSNSRLLESYGKCLLEKGPCTKEGNELKKILPQVLSSKCSKCTDEQKVKVKTALKLGLEKRKEIFDEVIKKYGKDEADYDSVIQWMKSDE